jgi:hypothetical protein
MNRKHYDAILCLLSVFCWFMPFHSMGGESYQAGNHIGGVAYMTLVIPIVYFYFSWNEEVMMRFILASSQVAVCLWLLAPRVSAGIALYGIISLTVVAFLMLLKSLLD